MEILKKSYQLYLFTMTKTNILNTLFTYGLGPTLVLAGLFLFYQDSQNPPQKCQGTVTYVEKTYRTFVPADKEYPYFSIQCDNGDILKGIYSQYKTKRSVQENTQRLQTAMLEKQPVTVWQDRHSHAFLGLSINGDVLRDGDKAHNRKKAFGPFVAFLGILLTILALWPSKTRKPLEK